MEGGGAPFGWAAAKKLAIWNICGLWTCWSGCCWSGCFCWINIFESLWDKLAWESEACLIIWLLLALDELMWLFCCGFWWLLLVLAVPLWYSSWALLNIENISTFWPFSVPLVELWFFSAPASLINFCKRSWILSQSEVPNLQNYKYDSQLKNEFIELILPDAIDFVLLV